MDDIPLPPTKSPEDYSPSQVTSDHSGDEEIPIPLPPRDDQLLDLPSPPKVHIPRSVLGKDNAKKRFQSFKAAKSGITFKPLKVKKTVLPLFKEDDEESSSKSKRQTESSTSSSGFGKMNIDSIIEEDKKQKREGMKLLEKKERTSGRRSSRDRDSAPATAIVPPPKLLTDLPPIFKPEAKSDKPVEKTAEEIKRGSKSATGEQAARAFNSCSFSI